MFEPSTPIASFSNQRVVVIGEGEISGNITELSTQETLLDILTLESVYVFADGRPVFFHQTFLKLGEHTCVEVMWHFEYCTQQ